MSYKCKECGGMIRRKFVYFMCVLLTLDIGVSFIVSLIGGHEFFMVFILLSEIGGMALIIMGIISYFILKMED